MSSHTEFFKDWEICVPTEMVDVASSLLKSEPYSHIYEPFQAASAHLFSMAHTYPRFKHKKRSDCLFLICPSDD